MQPPSSQTKNCYQNYVQNQTTPKSALSRNAIDVLHSRLPIGISFHIALIPGQTEDEVGRFGRIARPLGDMRYCSDHYFSISSIIHMRSYRHTNIQGLGTRKNSPPCPLGFKSVTNEVHMRAAICPSSKRAGSDPRAVIFWTGFAKTNGICTLAANEVSQYQI